MYGGKCHTNIDLGLLEGHPVPLVLGSKPPSGVKLSSFFKLFGSETGLGTMGGREGKGEQRGGTPG